MRFAHAFDSELFDRLQSQPSIIQRFLDILKPEDVPEQDLVFVEALVINNQVEGK